MIAIRIKTSQIVKDMQFEDHDKGNAWAKSVYAALGKPEEYRPRKVHGSILTISSELTIRELHEKGISFFGATHPQPIDRTKPKPQRAGRTKKKTK